MNNSKRGKWHVMYVKSRQEKKVHQLLQEKNLISFLPIIETIRQWSDRKKTVLKPLFPSYVFVNISSPLEFQQALSVDGACAYIRFGKEYASATDKEINQIKLLVGDKDISDIEINSQLPKVGDIKQISFGPLDGLECKVLKVGNKNKIIVRINSLQQSITASIPSYYLEQPIVN